MCGHEHILAYSDDSFLTNDDSFLTKLVFLVGTPPFDALPSISNRSHGQGSPDSYFKEHAGAGMNPGGELA